MRAGDRKIIDVTGKGKVGDNSRRVDIPCDDYVQVVLFDHVTRRRG